MPQIKKFGHRLRLGLYAFCLCSFMIYFIPILLAAMGTEIFLFSVAFTAFLVWKLAGFLTRKDREPKPNQIKLFIPAALVFGLILVFYFMKLIPPVPLSVKGHGIYHHVERNNGGYVLKMEKPPFYRFWQEDSRPFHAREGDAIYYFVRIFAPSRFKHQVLIRWERRNENNGEYVTTDHLPLKISGGRSEGYRGYAIKSNYSAGKYRVSTETSDGRTIGVLHFNVVEDTDLDERKWKYTRF